MKKIILSFFSVITFFTFSYSQATLPASHDFSGAPNLPTGWTANFTSNPTSDNFYTGSGNPLPAFAFKKDGRYLIINMASAPGIMTFDLAGNSFNGGTFEVQESVDGTTYTTNTVFDNSNVSQDGTYQAKQVTLNSSSRYIRFIYVLKVAGNIGLDNVVINEAAVTQQALKVVVDGEQIINNGTAYVGSAVNATTNLSFDIENTGSTGVLEIASITISGADASAFSLTTTPSYPLSINGSTTENIGINFTPTSAGTKNAVVTIESNDIDYPTFSFNVIGYGDNLATEPTAQPTALNFSNVKTYRLKSSFTTSGAEGYLVLRKNGAAITEVPVDGTSYTVGDVIGGAKVVQSSAISSFTPNDIVANSTYHFAVFAYNGTGNFTNYLTTSPLMNNVTTPANMIPAGKYDNINVASTTLIEDLHGLVAPHTQQFYSNYASYMMTKFYERDTTNNLKVVTDLYTGKALMYTPPFSHGNTGITREHTFASSWFPVTDIDANFYSDYHNLFPISQDEANAIRSNYPLGIVVSDTIQAVGESYMGKNALGQWVYEPSDIQKGAAARAMFYMCVRYTENGVIWKLPAIISSTISYGQDQELLKEWNIQFPPSKLEIARNDYLDSLQKNRNPFIDHPEYACYIDFSSTTYNADGCTVGTVENDLTQSVRVYPNPSKEMVTISTDDMMNEYRIYDIQGRLVRNVELNSSSLEMINVSSMETGVYTITIQTNRGTVTKKMIIE